MVLKLASVSQGLPVCLKPLLMQMYGCIIERDLRAALASNFRLSRKNGGRPVTQASARAFGVYHRDHLC